MRIASVLFSVLVVGLGASAAADAAIPGGETPPHVSRARLRAHRQWLDRVARKFPAWGSRLRQRRTAMLTARRAFLRNRKNVALRKKAFKATARYLKKALLPYKEFRLKLARKAKERIRVARLQEQIGRIRAKLATIKDAAK